MKKSDFTLKQQYEFVTGLYNGWCRQEELRRLTFPVERLKGNEELLEMFVGEDFKSDEDLRRKVESWIKETGGNVRRREENRERYLKARLKKIKAEAEAEERRVKENFKKELFAACLSRHRKQRRKRLKRVCRKAGTPVV